MCERECMYVCVCAVSEQRIEMRGGLKRCQDTGRLERCSDAGELGGGRNGMGWDGEAYMDYPSITPSLDVGLDMLGGQCWTLITTSFSGRRWGGAMACGEACLV